MQEEAEKQKLLEELKGKENVTPDGRKINIYANIGSVGDLGYVMENDAGGIGLFEVNSSILEEMISQRRKNSFRHINRPCRPWQAKSDYPYAGYRGR